MDCFLQPNDVGMSKNEHKMFFSVKYKMLKVKCNFPKRISPDNECAANCGEGQETDSHILFCNKLNDCPTNNELSIDTLYSDVCSPDQRKIIEKIGRNMAKREEIIQKDRIIS